MVSGEGREVANWQSSYGEIGSCRILESAKFIIPVSQFSVRRLGSSRARATRHCEVRQLQAIRGLGSGIGPRSGGHVHGVGQQYSIGET